MMFKNTGNLDVMAYLERINYKGPCQPTIDCLRQLHVAHLTSVPFENLSIHCGEDIVLDLPLVYDKVVWRHRGGFCYELNRLFAWLLEQMGFSVILISASVYHLYTQRYGPPGDHMLLLVSLSSGRRVLADVGFGSGFRLPLFLEDGIKDVQVNGTFRLRLDSGMWFMEQLNFTGLEPNTPGCVAKNGDVWVPRFKFNLTEKCWSDFSAMSIYQQVSPAALCCCKSLCSKHIPHGKITYMGWRVISTVYEDGKAQKTSRPITEEEIPVFLKDNFGFTLPSKLISKDEPIQETCSNQHPVQH
uniref:arylamine N-acetyltransferase, pineal gland isozyme NAT-3-like isoform X1 n=2 Tax=Myxine glutinosa TaxID=7769 RepID=UPI0035900FBE